MGFTVCYDHDGSILFVSGAPPLKKQAELFFPPEFADDFPVAMQISEKYGLVYVITKLGLLFVYDLQTATAVYRNRISPDPIFLTANSPTTGGFYAVNRWVAPAEQRDTEQTLHSARFIRRTAVLGGLHAHGGRCGAVPHL